MDDLLFVEKLSPLYEEVQLSGIFPDSKYFVDANPRFALNEILTNYTNQRKRPDFDLADFVNANFILPAVYVDKYESGKKPISKHLEELWQVLEKTPDQRGGTLIPLPYPYIVPGGRFREVYYWDSYFTMLGLRISGRLDIIENMVNNFSTLIERLGFIPNGNRTYYLSRSQPPFFACMIDLLSQTTGNEVLSRYYSSLKKEYAFWMDGENEIDIGRPYRRVVKLPDGSILNRYWDDRAEPRPEAYEEDLHLAKKAGRDTVEVFRHIRAAAESGWDFSSRWFKVPNDMSTIQTTHLIPVDLNCLILFMEQTLLRMSQQEKDGKEDHWKQRIKNRTEAIQKYCWNAEAGYYFDFDFYEMKLSENLTLAGMAPLFFSLAETEQALAVSGCIEKKFLYPGGVVTTIHQTGQQWDAPNGWAPLQWISYAGLRKYGFHSIAEKIRGGWLSLNEKVYENTGKMMEKYNVMDTTLAAGGGEYPNQDGFGWTNGVYLQFKNLG